MKQNTNRISDHHCEVLERRHLVSEMTKCDNSSKDHKKTYDCYLKKTKESRRVNPA